jgi:hypothetical protein
MFAYPRKKIEFRHTAATTGHKLTGLNIAGAWTHEVIFYRTTLHNNATVPNTWFCPNTSSGSYPCLRQNAWAEEGSCETIAYVWIFGASYLFELEHPRSMPSYFGPTHYCGLFPVSGNNNEFPLVNARVHYDLIDVQSLWVSRIVEPSELSRRA